MIKYTPSNQLSLSGFSHPFDQELSPDNRWIKLAQLIPWDALAAVYSKALSTTSGRESIDVRMVIGALITKHKLGLDDRGTVATISENIYLQYFCGLSSFKTKAPFHPTVFVDIRKRMGAHDFDAWNTLIIESADGLKPKKKQTISKDTGQDSKEVNENSPETITETKNKGTLKIDATVANQKIIFPTDAGLLKTARKETERFIDALYKLTDLDEKPRDYRRIARTEYLNFSKNRRKSKQTIRKFIRKQLGYVKRNLAYIDMLLYLIETQKTEQVFIGLFPEIKNPYPGKSSLSQRNQKLYWVI